MLELAAHILMNGGPFPYRPLAIGPLLAHSRPITYAGLVPSLTWSVFLVATPHCYCEQSMIVLEPLGMCRTRAFNLVSRLLDHGLAGTITVLGIGRPCASIDHVS